MHYFLLFSFGIAIWVIGLISPMCSSSAPQGGFNGTTPCFRVQSYDGSFNELCLLFSKVRCNLDSSVVSISRQFSLYLAGHIEFLVYFCTMLRADIICGSLLFSSFFNINIAKVVSVKKICLSK